MASDEILGELVNPLRQARLLGARAADLVARLEEMGLTSLQIADHMSAAFCLETPLNPSILECDEYDYEEANEEGVNPTEAVMSLIDDEIVEARKVWEGAPPYPDLMRRRDRNAFRELAVSEAATVVVAGANPFSGRHIGQPGTRVSPLHLFGVARLAPPNAGLVAADPDDGRLAALLESAYPGGRYEDFVSELARCGFTVTGPDEGYVLRDAGWNLLHPGYSVQGVYREEGGADLWRGAEGERMRAALNRQMGLELVRHGPHDAWDVRVRLPDDCPARGPQVPVLVFSPQGNVNVLFNVDEVAARYRFLGIAWSELYPGIVEKIDAGDEDFADDAFDEGEESKKEEF